MRRALASAVALVLLASAAAAVAQDGRCTLPPFRGGATSQGAMATMIVVNDGQPCAIELYGQPAQAQNPATDVAVTRAPTRGTVRIDGHRAAYTPQPGYAGEDEFAVRARALGANGRGLDLKVQVKVTVRPPR